MKENRLRGLFKNKNFKLLFSGEIISNIGDQFTIIALAWLVAQMTGSAAAVGITLALSGFPRAVLMLVSGSFIDRYSPRKIMILSNMLRFAVVLTLGILILSGGIELWMVYVIAFLFGIFDAFFIPARSSLVPLIVPEKILGIGNSFIQGLTQLSQFIGPVFAGILIAYFENKHNSLNGIGYAFLIDAFTFTVSIATLYLLRDIKESSGKIEPMIQMIKSGFLSVWKQPGLWQILITATLVNFFFIGPFLVGMPIIAKNYLSGANSYGFIMSAWGVGALIGYGLSGFLFRPKKNAPVYILSVASLIGFSFFIFTFADTTFKFAAFSFINAIATGFVIISLMTIIQKNTPKHMMGRTMSVILFSSIGLNPVSQLITGQIMERYSHIIFQISGVCIMVVALLTLCLRSVRSYGNTN